MLREAGACALAVALWGAVAWTSYLLASRLLRRSRPHARWALAWSLTLALQVTLFYVLGAVRGFAAGPLALAMFGLTATAHIAWGRPASARFSRDVASVAALWRRLGWWRLGAVVCLPVAVRLARAVVSPPLGWDALTYHLPRAVEWVQQRGPSPLPGPDAAAYYSYFPPYGDIAFAWAMVVVRSDALLPLVGAWSWFGVWIGGYALARTLRAPRTASLASAAVTASVPAVASYASASYVDNTALALLLVGLTFVVRTTIGWRVGDGVAAGASLGLLMGAKSSAVPVVLLAAAWIALGAWRRRTVGAVLAAAAMLFVAAAPPFVRAHADTGNPMYPLTVTSGPRTLLEGDPLLAETMRFGARTMGPIMKSLFSWHPMETDHDRLGFGPAAVALPILTAIGVWRLRRRAPLLLLLAIAAVVFGVTMTSDATVLWAVWRATTPRLVTGSLGVLAAIAARANLPTLLWIIALASAVLALPRGMGPSETHALMSAWPAFAALAALGGMAVLLVRAGRLAIGIATAHAAIVAAVLVAAPTRAAARASVYADASRGVAFDLHSLGPEEAAAWPLWRTLEQRPPLRLALAAGFWGAGHNWYRYPLYGAHLQHQVTYVPITADGRLLSYRDPTFTQTACPTCWEARLRSSRIDALVTLAPLPPEATWARERPTAFREWPNTGTAVVFDVRAASP